MEMEYIKELAYRACHENMSDVDTLALIDAYVSCCRNRECKKIVNFFYEEVALCVLRTRNHSEPLPAFLN
jgi:hypothetical protein